MMKNFTLLLSLLCFSRISFSQNSFIVLNEEGVAVNGADVFYKKKRIGITSKEGRFLMPQAPAGDTITFESAGLIAKYVVQANKTAGALPQVIYLAPQGFPPKEEQEDRWGDALAVPPMKEPSGNDILSVPEEFAEFPGGISAQQEWIKKNLKYPPAALKSGVQGKCFVKFIVEKDGSISDVQVVRSVPDCPECGNEAVRLVKAMPKWKPAIDKGVAVRSYLHLPVAFKIE